MGSLPTFDSWVPPLFVAAGALTIGVVLAILFAIMLVEHWVNRHRNVASGEERRQQKQRKMMAFGARSLRNLN